jgi:hypothetical protein
MAPYYAMALRDGHRRPVQVVVVATESAVADWARRPIDLFPGLSWRPFVIGPGDLPRIDAVEPDERTAVGALVSIAFHVDSVEELKVVDRAMTAVWPPPDLDVVGGRRGYTEKALVLMKPAMRGLVEAMMAQPQTNDSGDNVLLRWFAAERAAGLEEGREKGREEGREEGREKGREEGREEGREKGREEGRAVGVRDILLRLARLRGFNLSADQRRKVDACDDPTRLSEWVERLMAGASLDETLAA